MSDRRILMAFAVYSFVDEDGLPSRALMSVLADSDGSDEEISELCNEDMVRDFANKFNKEINRDCLKLPRLISTNPDVSQDMLVRVPVHAGFVNVGGWMQENTIDLCFGAECAKEPVPIHDLVRLSIDPLREAVGTVETFHIEEKVMEYKDRDYTFRKVTVKSHTFDLEDFDIEAVKDIVTDNTVVSLRIAEVEDEDIMNACDENEEWFDEHAFGDEEYIHNILEGELNTEEQFILNRSEFMHNDSVGMVDELYRSMAHSPEPINQIRKALQNALLARGDDPSEETVH